MTDSKPYVIAHRPCPFCSKSLVVDPMMNSYVCANKSCPQYHTYVCVPVSIGRRYADKWVADASLTAADIGKRGPEPEPEPTEKDTDMALNVEHSTRTVTTHRFRVETNPPVGAVIGDILAAYNMAAAEAKGMGINTSYDDWARMHAEDDAVVIEFEAPSTK